MGSGDGWRPAVPLEELREGKAVAVALEEARVLLVRWGREIHAVSDRCTHQGAPLHRGVVRAAGSPKTVTCPIHGSVFQLTDGRVLRGPATTPLAAYDTRVVDGIVEVRPRAAPSGP
ncbi:MAG TPA: Rieske (2Fe-2S) protein [Actinomycetota bacterium]|nr:Rieske (2Fe-2S) protein [Actinomycetota bacterium]